jgi:hypothetical protein
MARKPENVRVEHVSNSKAAACFEMDGARFHVWFNTDILEREHILYKNPPQGTGSRDPGYFATRRLDATNRANKVLVDGVFQEIKERGLIEAAKEAQAAEQAKIKEANEAAYRRRLKKEAGPELYEALKELLEAQGDGWMPPEDDPRMRAARAALAKAEHGGEHGDEQS